MRDQKGFLLVNKPRGVTSRRVVDVAQRRLPGLKIGHCGTLDPLAEGLLVLAVGRSRRLTQFVQELPKVYQASMRLGVVSATWDTESPMETGGDYSGVTESALREVLSRFVGEIEQIPPEFSAVRVGGKRAYELARKGKSLSLKPRKVRIYRIELRRFMPPDVELVIECGGGTYIRSLIRDIGEMLGCGAVMMGLVRTAIGRFDLSQACTLEDLEKAEISLQLLPPILAVVHLPRAELDQVQVELVRHGRPLRAEMLRIVPPELSIAPEPDDRVALVLPPDDLVGVAEYDRKAGLVRPRIVLAEP